MYPICLFNMSDVFGALLFREGTNVVQQQFFFFFFGGKYSDVF